MIQIVPMSGTMHLRYRLSPHLFTALVVLVWPRCKILCNLFRRIAISLAWYSHEMQDQDNAWAA